MAVNAHNTAVLSLYYCSLGCFELGHAESFFVVFAVHIFESAFLMSCIVLEVLDVLTYTARLWSSSSAGWGSSACPLFPPLSHSPRRNRTGRWFSSGAPRTECPSRGRRAERRCTPPVRAPRSAAGLCGISGGCSCSQRPRLAWCRPRHILTAGSHTSHTGHSPELPSDTGSGHPQKGWKLGDFTKGAQ